MLGIKVDLSSVKLFQLNNLENTNSFEILKFSCNNLDESYEKKFLLIFDRKIGLNAQPILQS